MLKAQSNIHTTLIGLFKDIIPTVNQVCFIRFST